MMPTLVFTELNILRCLLEIVCLNDNDCMCSLIFLPALWCYQRKIPSMFLKGFINIQRVRADTWWTNPSFTKLYCLSYTIVLVK